MSANSPAPIPSEGEEKGPTLLPKTAASARMHNRSLLLSPSALSLLDFQMLSKHMNILKHPLVRWFHFPFFLQTYPSKNSLHWLSHFSLNFPTLASAPTGESNGVILADGSSQAFALFDLSALACGTGELFTLCRVLPDVYK